MSWLSSSSSSPLFLCLLLVLLLTANAQFNFNFEGNRDPLPDCIGDIVSINERVLVRMTGNPKNLTPIEIANLEKQFRDSYNMLAVSACSGGSYISINAVDVQEDFLESSLMSSSSNNNDSNQTIATEFTLRVQVYGTCRGCQKDALFTLLNSVGGRKLQQDEQQWERDMQQDDDEDDEDQARKGKGGKGRTRAPTPAPTPIPPCPDCIPPTESAFAATFNAGIQFLQVNNIITNVETVAQVTELDEVVCENDITEFSSDVFIDFLGTSRDVTDAQLRSLEQAFLETYNELNLLNDGTCDVFFRQIIDVQATLDADLNRRLQGGITISVPFSIRFRILAICRDCDPNASLLSVGRSVASTFRSSNRNYRALQGASNDLCFCPREADFRTPSRVEFQKSLSNILNSERFDKRVAFITSVGRVLEVDAVDCPDNVDFFEATVTAQFSGDPDALSTANVRQLEELFVESYNEAQESFCDPFFRTAINATLVREIDTSTQRDLQILNLNLTNFFTFLFRIIGRCRFCGGDSALFNDASRKRELRFLDNGKAFAPEYYGHRLQEDDGTCFCDVNFLEQRSPSEDEFQFLYDRNVQGGNTGVGNVASVDIFITEPPSFSPSDFPSTTPSALPSARPSARPSAMPSSSPSLQPTDVPSKLPSSMPSTSPSSMPSDIPSDVPSVFPSDVPSDAPSDVPSVFPSLYPSSFPSDFPSSYPSDYPSDLPSLVPSQGGKGNVPQTPRPTARPTNLIKRPSFGRRLLEEDDSSQYQANIRRGGNPIRRHV